MFGFLFVAAAVLSYVVANSEEQTQHQSLSCGIGGTQKMVMASTFPNHYSNDFNVTIGGTQNIPAAVDGTLKDLVWRSKSLQRVVRQIPRTRTSDPSLVYRNCWCRQ